MFCSAQSPWSCQVKTIWPKLFGICENNVCTRTLFFLSIYISALQLLHTWTHCKYCGLLHGMELTCSLNESIYQPFIHFYTNYCLEAIQEVCEVKCSITLESYDTRISTRSKQYPAVAQQTEEGLNSAKVSDSLPPPGRLIIKSVLFHCNKGSSE